MMDLELMLSVESKMINISRARSSPGVYCIPSCHAAVRPTEVAWQVKLRRISVCKARKGDDEIGHPSLSVRYTARHVETQVRVLT